MEEYLVEKLIPKLIQMDSVSDQTRIFLKFTKYVVIECK